MKLTVDQVLVDLFSAKEIVSLKTGLQLRIAI